MIKPHAVHFTYASLENFIFRKVEHAELIYGKNIKNVVLYFDLSKLQSRPYYINFIIKNTGIYCLEDFLVEELSFPTDYMNKYFRKRNRLNISYENDKIIIPLMILQNKFVIPYNHNEYYIRLFLQTRTLDLEKFDKLFFEKNTYIEIPEDQKIYFVADLLTDSLVQKLNNKIECIMIMNWSYMHRHEDEIKKSINKCIDVKFKRGIMSCLILLTNIHLPFDDNDNLIDEIIYSNLADNIIVLYSVKDTTNEVFCNSRKI